MHVQHTFVDMERLVCVPLIHERSGDRKGVAMQWADEVARKRKEWTREGRTRDGRSVREKQTRYLISCHNGEEIFMLHGYHIWGPATSATATNAVPQPWPRHQPMVSMRVSVNWVPSAVTTWAATTVWGPSTFPDHNSHLAITRCGKFTAQNKK